MSLFERIKTINEKKYFPNTGDKKPKGILRNIGDYIRKTGADPMGSGDYGSSDKDFGKADKTKPQYRGGRTSQDFPTTKNIKKGSIPEPATILPPATVGGKSKGATPVNVNITKSQKGADAKVITKNPIKKTIGVKQSDVSKKAKEFTVKVNKRRAERIKGATGGKTTGSLAKGNLSFPGDRSGAYKATKTDLETKKLFKKAGASGDVSNKAPSEIRKRVEKVRSDRAIKQGTPDPFKIDTSKAAREVEKKFGKKPVTTGIDKPTTPQKKIFKTFRQDTKRGAIADIRDSEKRLYMKGVGKKPSLVQQRKFFKNEIAAINRQKNLELRRSQYDFMGGDSGMGQPEVEPGYKAKNKRTVEVIKQTVNKNKVPDKFKVDKPKDYKQTKQFKQQTQFINKKTGKPFNMADPSQKKEYLKQQGKDRFVDQTRNRVNKSSKGKSSYKPPASDFETFGNRRTSSNRYQQFKDKVKNVKGFRGNVGKRAAVSKLAGKYGNVLKTKPGRTVLATAAAGYALYKGGKYLFNKAFPKKDTVKFEKTPVNFSKGNNNPAKINYNPKNDPSKLRSLSKTSLNFKDIQNFGKGKPYSVSGKSLNQRLYSPTELKNTQRRVKQNKNKIDSNTGFFKGDPYGMLDTKTRKASQRFTDFQSKLNKK